MWINITMRLPLEQPWTSYTYEDIHVNLQNAILFVFLMYHTFLVHLYLYYTLLYIGISIYTHSRDMHHHIPSTTTPFRPEANNDLPIFFGCFRVGRISTNHTTEAMRVLDLCALDLFGWSETKR